MSHPHEPSTRRQFLGRTAAIAGAASLGTAHPLAGAVHPPLRQDGPRAARAPLADGEPVRVAVVGTGGMGRGHCSSLVGLARDGRAQVQVVAVCDVAEHNREAARALCATEQGIEVATYSDHRELLARPDLHGVVIATPEHWHAQMSLDAIQAGKDVYCEKPMTLRLDEALELRRGVQASDAIFQVGTQYVSLPMWVQARDLIAAGGIGHPTCSQTSYCRNSKAGEWLYYEIDERFVPGETLDWERWCGALAPAEWDPEVYFRWRRYKKWSTGIIGDLLVHKITPMIMAVDAGWPVRVTASGGHLVDLAMENHDQVNLMIEFEHDHTMFVMGSTCNATGVEDLIRGHEANLYVSGNRLVLKPETIYADDIDPRIIDCESVGDSQDQHRVNWLESIRTRAQPLADVELGTKIMVVVDLATRSLWDGGAWTFDPETFTARRA